MTEEVRIAILEATMKDIKDSMHGLQVDVQALGKQVDNILNTKIMDHATMQAEIKSQEKQIEQLEKTSNLWRWLSPTVAAVAAAAIEYLFIFYLQHLK